MLGASVDIEKRMYSFNSIRAYEGCVIIIGLRIRLSLCFVLLRSFNPSCDCTYRRYVIGHQTVRYTCRSGYIVIYIYFFINLLNVSNNLIIDFGK